MPNTYFEDKDQAIFYQKYRQHAPDVVFEKIMEFVGEKMSSYKVAVDVGCGSGQSTNVLADYFDSVFGSDISKEQIKQAAFHRKPNVNFRVCPSENLDFVNNSSVQLVTVSVALHWFNIEKFFQEVDRILEPNGVLAVFSHTLLDIYHPDYPEIHEVYKKFDQDVLASNWPSNIQLNSQEYKTVKLPYSEEKIYREENAFKTVQTFSLDELIGYIQSMSPYQVYMKKNPRGKDNLLHLKNSILEIFKKRNATDVSLQFPGHYFLLMCRKPPS